MDAWICSSLAGTGLDQIFLDQESDLDFDVTRMPQFLHLSQQAVYSHLCGDNTHKH
jgi:hypothetical protein